MFTRRRLDTRSCRHAGMATSKGDLMSTILYPTARAHHLFLQLPGHRCMALDMRMFNDPDDDPCSCRP